LDSTQAPDVTIARRAVAPFGYQAALLIETALNADKFLIGKLG
jgi:hypothetical protein